MCVIQVTIRPQWISLSPALSWCWIDFQLTDTRSGQSDNRPDADDDVRCCFVAKITIIPLLVIAERNRLFSDTPTICYFSAAFIFRGTKIEENRVNGARMNDLWKCPFHCPAYLEEQIYGNLHAPCQQLFSAGANENRYVHRRLLPT